MLKEAVQEVLPEVKRRRKKAWMEEILDIMGERRQFKGRDETQYREIHHEWKRRQKHYHKKIEEVENDVKHINIRDMITSKWKWNSGGAIKKKDGTVVDGKE